MYFRKKLLTVCFLIMGLSLFFASERSAIGSPPEPVDLTFYEGCGSFPWVVDHAFDSDDWSEWRDGCQGSSADYCYAYLIEVPQGSWWPNGDCGISATLRWKENTNFWSGNYSEDGETWDSASTQTKSYQNKYYYYYLKQGGLDIDYYWLDDNYCVYWKFRVGTDKYEVIIYLTEIVTK